MAEALRPTRASLADQRSTVATTTAWTWPDLANCAMSSIQSRLEVLRRVLDQHLTWEKGSMSWQSIPKARRGGNVKGRKGCRYVGDPRDPAIPGRNGSFHRRRRPAQRNIVLSVRRECSFLVLASGSIGRSRWWHWPWHRKQRIPRSMYFCIYLDSLISPTNEGRWLVL